MSNFGSYRFPVGGADQSNLPGSPEKLALPENRWSELSLNGLKRYNKFFFILKTLKKLGFYMSFDDFLRIL